MTNGIEKDTFQGMQTEAKLNVLFDYVREIRDKPECQIGKCEPRLKKLEDRKWKDRGISSASGLFGGFIAVITLKISKLLP